MISYLEVYAREISPRLRAIDLWLKSGEHIPINEAALLLGVDEDEITRITGARSALDASDMLRLMSQGTGAISGMYRRELELNSPITYTAADVAYIYDIEGALVEAAFDRLNAKAVTALMLPAVFARIWL